MGLVLSTLRDLEFERAQDGFCRRNSVRGAKAPLGHGENIDLACSLLSLTPEKLSRRGFAT